MSYRASLRSTGNETRNRDAGVFTYEGGAPPPPMDNAADRTMSCCHVVRKTGDLGTVGSAPAPRCTTARSAGSQHRQNPQL